MKSKNEIAVLGDVVINWMEHSKKSFNYPGPNNLYNWQRANKMRYFVRPGGALLLAAFLKQMSDRGIITYELEDINTIPPSEIIRSSA